MSLRIIDDIHLPLCWTFIVSHTWIELSSLPANRNLPDTDSPQEVNPEVEFGGLYMAICWSDLMSYKRADLSSEAVANPYPLLWNCETQVYFLIIFLKIKFVNIIYKYYKLRGRRNIHKQNSRQLRVQKTLVCILVPWDPTIYKSYPRCPSRMYFGQMTMIKKRRLHSERLLLHLSSYQLLSPTYNCVIKTRTN